MIDFYTRLLEFKDIEGARTELRSKRTPTERRNFERDRYHTDPAYQERRKRTNLASYYRRKQKRAQP